MSEQATNEQAAQPRKWWATALMIGAVIGFICLPVAAIGTRLGLWPFTLGIPMMGVGTVLCVIALFLGIIAYVVCVSKGYVNERRSIFIALALSVVVVGVSLSQFNAATSVPQIHNISTDTINPPQFDKLIAARKAEGANPLEYDTGKLADTQREAYPQVQSLVSDVAQGEMVNRVTGVLESMGLEVASVDAAAGRVEATDTTFWFGFKDDVVVRVRAENAGSVVDIRSVSRVGESDLGKNAARIMEILQALRAI